MKPREIFAKTMPFAWAKLLLGLATIVVSIVIFAILMGIAYLFQSDGVFIVMFIIWIGATGVVNFIINHYIGYLIKAGHVAVITEAVTSGSVPDNQMSYGKEMVKERFLTSNIYFVIDKLVAGAVKQIQRGVEKIGNKMGNFIPGMNFVTNIAKMFVGIALGYIDECCLGYTFYKKKQGAFKSAADGVVIYAQNWKTLLKDAAKTTAMVILLVIVVTLISFALFAGIFRLFGWEGGLGGFVAFLLACFFAVVIKKAFIDSYILVKMMTSYMQVAPKTTISFDLYNKLCGISAKFKELFNKGQDEKSGTTGKSKEEKPATTGKSKAKTEKPAASSGKGKAKICGKCGAKNEAGTKFCGNCGKKL